MRKAFFLFMILSISSLYSEDNDPNALYLSSGLADYDGQSIRLSEDVFLDHGLGQIHARDAELLRVTPKGGLYFQVLKLKGSVDIVFKDGGFLNCHRAEINCLTSDAKFYGDTPIKRVVYNDIYNGAAIVLRSKQMIAKISQSDDGNYYTKNIIALDNVTANYANEYIAVADEAIYNRISDLCSSETEQNQHPGTIYLLPYRENGSCNITSINGDIFEAQSICLDASKKSFLCDSPHGKLNVYNDTVNFQAGKASWFQSSTKLFLSDNVIIEGLLARIYAEQKIECQCIDGVWTKFHSTGNSSLSYNDKHSGKHSLTTLGKIFVNYNTLEASVKKSDSDDQVLYTDRVGNIRADIIKIEYSKDFKPLRIYLEGNICVINNAPFKEGSKQKVLQYALADIVEYFPEKELMILRNDDGGKVLFYDKINDVQISATSIEYKRDENSSFGAVKGHGNVCVKFSQEELEKIKQRFL